MVSIKCSPLYSYWLSYWYWKLPLVQVSVPTDAVVLLQLWKTWSLPVWKARKLPFSDNDTVLARPGVLVVMISDELCQLCLTCDVCFINVKVLRLSAVVGGCCVLLSVCINQGRLVTFCIDNSLHLWEINVKPTGATVLEEVKSFAVDDRCEELFFVVRML